MISCALEKFPLIVLQTGRSVPKAPSPTSALSVEKIVSNPHLPTPLRNIPIKNPWNNAEGRVRNAVPGMRIILSVPRGLGVRGREGEGTYAAK